MTIPGDVAPTGNTSTLNTANYTYLAVLDPATWHEALELCQLYGKDFYLASLDGQYELDEIKAWLADLPKPGRNSELKSLLQHSPFLPDTYN